ncbi:hypothetical protein CXB51_022103 [Gossypium anomalum]|uniref:CCHC-type domain-containing protein n=1 Tax=Gossypium anomalum TaxID=47600 RepID=A0A8J6CX19_9ROSI|nr:hypothetical protein CXB51_022103 [Gossypium anomalum]
MEEEKELALLEEELIQHRLRAQLGSIWKTRKKIEILIVGQNLFSISFEDEEDPEQIMEGRLWFFRKQLLLFDRITEPMEWGKIRLVTSPFWIKIGPCPPKCDKKNLMHTVGSTFEGVIRSEIKGELCRRRVNLDVQKPLRRGIFVSLNKQGKTWLPFKYETLPTFCFGCGQLRHGVKECTKISSEDRTKAEEELPYSIALEAEPSIIGKESIWLGP